MSDAAIDKQILEIETKARRSKDIDKLASSIAKLRAVTAPAASSLSPLSRALGELNSMLTRMGRRTGDLSPLAGGLRRLAEVNLFSAGAGLRQFARASESLSSSGLQSQEQSGGSGGSGGGFSLSDLMSYIATVRKAGEAIGKTISEMNSYVKDVNMFTASMGEFAGEGRSFAASMEGKLGVDSGEVMRSMTQFQQLGTTFGVTSDQAYLMSKNMTQLGYDLSSAFGMSTEESFSMLQSGMSGEAGSLSGIGVDLSEARLQQELYAMGVDRTVDSLSQADMALLRYTSIMQQTGSVQNCMAKTLESPANALRVLQAQISITIRWIGAMFIPVLSKVISWVIAFVMALGQIARSVAAAFGFEMPEIQLPESKGSLKPASDEISGVGDSAKQAKKEVDALIGGFDEMHILNQNDSPAAGDTGGTAGAGGDVLSGLELPDYDMFEGLAQSDIAEKAAKLKGPLEEILKLAGGVGAAFVAWKVGQNLFEGFDLLKGVISGVSGLAKGISFSGVKVPLTGLGTAEKTAVQLGPSLAGAGATALGVAATIGLMVWRLIDLYQNSETFRKGLSRVWEIIVMVKDVVADLLSYFAELGKKAGLWLLSFLPEDMQKVILDVFGKIQDFLADMDLGFADVGISALGIGLLFTPAAPFGLALLVFEAITVAIRAIGSMSDETWEKVKSGIKNALDSMLNLVKSVFTKKFWVGLFNGIKEAFIGVWEGIKSDLSSNKDQMIASIAGLKDGFIELWENIKTSVFEAWEAVRNWTVTKWEEIKTAIFDAFGSIKEFIFVTLPEIVGSVVTWFTELPEKIAYALGFVLGKIVLWTVELYETIVTEVPKIIEGVVNFFITLPERIYGALCGLGESLMLWGEETWATLTELVTAIVDGAVAFFTELPSKVFAAIITIKDSLILWGAETLEAIGLEVTRIVDSAAAKFLELGGKAYTAICSFKDKVVQFGQDAIAWFAVEMPKVIAAVAEWFKGLPQKILEAVAAVKDAIKNIGQHILDGIFEGLANIKEKLGKWKDSFVQGFKDALGIHSPSTIMRDEVGVHLAAGVAEGLHEGTAGVVAEAENMAQAVQHVFNGITYSMDTDYTALRNEAMEKGDTESAEKYEEIRRAKIQGEGLSYALDDDVSVMLQDMGSKTDVSNEALSAIRDLTTTANDAETLRYENSITQKETETKDLHDLVTKLMTDWTTAFNAFLIDWKSAMTSLKSEISGAAGRIVSSTDRIRINIYNSYGSGEVDVFASGGFPRQGSMFLASEAGPELVGTLGNRTAVVNNEQIVESVSEGVAEAVGKAMRQYGQSTENRTIIELDGDVIYDSSKKVEQRRGYNFGLGAFAR